MWWEEYPEPRAKELCEVELGVLGSLSVISLMASVDVKQHLKEKIPGLSHKTLLGTFVSPRAGVRTFFLSLVISEGGDILGSV